MDLWSILARFLITSTDKYLQKNIVSSAINVELAVIFLY